MISFALFETGIGTCSLAWNERGLVRVLLPDRSAAALRRRTLDLVPGVWEERPRGFAAAAAQAMSALLRGEARDLRDVPLDMDGVPPFHQRVYEIARTIEPGKTSTYGEIAGRLALPGAARAVGQALGRNPFAIVVPCHRVLASGGKTGGFSAPGGASTKLKMLAIEGAQVPGALTLFP